MPANSDPRNAIAGMARSYILYSAQRVGEFYYPAKRRFAS